MTTDVTIEAVDIAQVAREVAMDIFPKEDIQKLHNLSDDQWADILASPIFVKHLETMQREWNSAGNTEERIKVKAQTGVESLLEVYVRDIANERLPLRDRVEAGKFLAKLGDLGEPNVLGVGGSGGFQITLNIGNHKVSADASPKVIEHEH
jgi:hypothetical protein